MEEKERKAQELRERDNPKMCKPMEAIPMPYKGEGEEGQINLYKSNPKLDKNWHNDLKAVLFRKALLVYITLSEISFSTNNYGYCLKNIKRALNCFNAIVNLSTQEHGENVKMLLGTFFKYDVNNNKFCPHFVYRILCFESKINKSTIFAKLLLLLLFWSK